MLSPSENDSRKRLHYYVHGRGRGHAARAQAVIEVLLKEGFSVSVFAGEDAFPMLSDRCECNRVRSVMPSSNPRQFQLILSRTRSAVHHIRKEVADLVISDGDLPAILAAIWTRKPSIAMGHSEVFGRCARPKDLPRLPWWKEAFVARLSAPTASAYVAVNFVPIEHRRANVTLARPNLRSDIPKKRKVGDRILCYFRDENGDNVLQSLLELQQTPMLFSKHPEKHRAGVAVSPLGSKAFGEALSKAKAVVASAGSQLLSECVTMEIPLFALYKENDSEQRLNVGMLRGYGLGDGCSFSNFNAQRLSAFLKKAKDPIRQSTSPWEAPQVSEAIISTVNHLLHARVP
ncbi:MAG: hypothetical protein GY854_25890 [Deltaproteobacteria bacterium]|nr:hypothetical protein [Deltaproteobacteria bacterium]